MLREKLSRLKPVTVVTALDAGRGQRDVLHLLANRHRALQGSGEGKLDVDIQKPLVFFRQEPGRQCLAQDRPTASATKPRNSRLKPDLRINARQTPT